MDGVELWDLRKLKNFRSFTPYDSNTPTNSVEFDFSGSYLALAGSDIRVYQVANVKLEWNFFKTFPDLSGAGKITSVKFGADAKYMAVGSMDVILGYLDSHGIDQRNRNPQLIDEPQLGSANLVFTSPTAFVVAPKLMEHIQNRLGLHTILPGAADHPRKF